MSHQSGYVYRVVRDLWGPSHAEISLVRGPGDHGLLGHVHRRRHGEEVVLFRRSFRPRIELDELERYAAELGRVAQHGNDGTLGCFLDTRSTEGRVEIALFERWFDGHHLRCDELARREFDASEEDALVASAEFIAELEEWADRRNQEREAAYRQASVEDEARRDRALEKQSAAEELARILGRERTDG